MFGSTEDTQDLVADPGDEVLAELVWRDPAEWEPYGDLDCAPDDWDTALDALVLAGIAESEALADNRLAALDDRALVELAGQTERDLRAATALGYHIAAELARRHPDPSGHKDEQGLSAYALDEIALATGLARGVVCGPVAEADALTGRHPKLLAALGAGLLPLPAVRRVLDTTLVLDAPQCGVVETGLLNRLGRPDRLRLGDLTPADLAALSTDAILAVSTRASTARVGRLARDLVHRVNPEAAAKRETRAKAQRDVRFEPGSNGMSWLSLHLPDALAWASYEHIDALAHALPNEPDDDRPLDAKRADVAVGLLMGDPATTPAPVNLRVIVDHTGCDLASPSHSGLVSEAGRLGPVSAETVRELLDLATLSPGSVSGAHAIPVACPGAEAHLVDGPGPYQPSERLRTAVQARDRSCVFPGCLRPAAACEVDHTLRHPEGPTCSCSLGEMCVHHHHLKHHAPGWRLVNHGGGHFTWTTPTGRTFDVRPDREPPRPPPAEGSDPDPPPY